MTNKIGIDAGGSLIKIAYEEQGKFHVKTYGNDESKNLIQWLTLLNPNASLYITGGKSTSIKEQTMQQCVYIEEFEAVTRGARFLVKREIPSFQDDFILVSLGTGTSIFHVTEEASHRLLGSGIGGGTLMGLGSIITGRRDYQHLVSLAEKGSSQKSDLLVRDIYAPDEPPIPGDLTAANFGKAHFNMQARAEDHIAALIRLIGETIISLASQAARILGVEKIVFVGSTLNGNKPLKEVLSGFQSMMQYEPIFLEKGSYAGAIGTLIS
ncbi:type II pantothenate kinase [Oceanobacillus sp. Castelsardo]|uniref:type II pantothenate kinase n=1 Tax=Oceanobacillus sp. Castelsardo TaxID=1851204 RepID=UPI000837B7ED|nr:type II pantothenate kinase [Oceanobacillus sp. Castelsardo]